jgi:hypothetical protein
MKERIGLLNAVVWGVRLPRTDIGKTIPLTAEPATLVPGSDGVSVPLPGAPGIAVPETVAPPVTV